MRVFRQFYVRCEACGRRYRPDHSPRVGIAKALLKQLPSCKHCGHYLNEMGYWDGSRPIVKVVKAQLVEAGFLDKNGAIVDPPPPGNPFQLVAFRRDSREQEEEYDPC